MWEGKLPCGVGAPLVGHLPRRCASRRQGRCGLKNHAGPTPCDQVTSDRPAAPLEPPTSHGQGSIRGRCGEPSPVRTEAQQGLYGISWNLVLRVRRDAGATRSDGPGSGGLFDVLRRTGLPAPVGCVSACLLGRHPRCGDAPAPGVNGLPSARLVTRTKESAACAMYGTVDERCPEWGVDAW